MSTPTLNQDEVAALMNAIQDGQLSEENAKPSAAVVPYDLTSQDRIIRGQMPTLDAINEQVASMVGTGLAGRTRLQLRVSSSQAALVRFSDMASMLSPPSTVAVISMCKGAGHAVMVLEPRITDGLLSAAMGDRKAQGDAPPSDLRRDLTAIEKQVLKRLLTLFTDAMGTAWARVHPFKPEVVRIEADPRMAMVAPPNETAILCSFEVSGALGGRVQLAIPFTAVEPAKKLLAAPPRMHAQGDSRFVNNMARELEQVQVEVRAILGTTAMDFHDVLELEPGAVLTLDTSEGAAIEVLVEGRVKLAGQPTVIGGSMAVVVDRGLTDAEADSPCLAPTGTEAPRPSLEMP